MSLEKRKLDNSEVYALLRKNGEGHLLTDTEKQMLSSVNSIVWRSNSLGEVPKSLSLLTSLTSLSLIGTEIKDIRALSKLTSLTNLGLSGTEVKDISVLSKLTSLTDLDLSKTEVKDISALSNLTSLKRLNLGGSKVKDISVLSNLTSLTGLDLSNTQIDDISALSNLTSLTNLDSSRTEVKDISALSNLTSLTSLDLSDTQVEDISVLSHLTSLRSLDLSDTQVKDIRVLNNLVSLTDLNLSGTQVRDISSLSGLKNLVILDLSRSQINDLSVLSKLFALRKLILQNSKTNSIPKGLLDLKLNFITEEGSLFLFVKSGIYIHGLTLTDQPIEIFSQSKDLIRAYYGEGDQVPVNECKVIFLGDAESGKTHSIKRLLKKGEYLRDVDFNGEATPGIETTVSTIKLENSDIRINYWDFGGQEIQHSMHRMFLTERTVYAVFLNARQDDQMDERARYWLENIKAFAPDAPVLVVINKTDENNHPRFNEAGITSDYRDQVKKVIRLSAKKDTPKVFIEKLQDSIKNIILDLPTVKKEIPRTWKNLMESIRSMPDHYLTARQFIDKCSFFKVQDYEDIHDDLVDLFQVIGVSFCYHKDRATADYMLLNPKWILNALYTIVTNGKLVSRNGVISQNDLFDLLKKDRINGEIVKRVIPQLRYEGFEVNYILGVIRTFRLSYRLEDGSEFFPMLCDGNEKKSVADVPGDALHFIFRYKYLPTNIMHRLIVGMQEDVDNQLVWYTGAVFRNESQNQNAYVHSLGNDLHIYVYGEQECYSLNEYMTPILNKVRTINKNMGLSAEELLTYRINGKETEIPFDEVMENLRLGSYTRYDSKVKTVIDYREIARRYMDKRPRINKILQSIIKALGALQTDKTYHRNAYNSRDLENSRNHSVSKYLEAAGYNCSEQSPGGLGENGYAAGERDIVIKDIINQEILIYEGLNIANLDKTYIDRHIKKLLINYNPKGLRKGVLVTYLECDRDKYLSFITGYRKHIAEYAPEGFRCVGEPINIPSYGQLLTCLGMYYESGGLNYLVYHIIVRVAP